MTTSPNWIAKGDINPCRFVKQDTSNDFAVLEADANEMPVGISQEGTKAVPIPGASTLAAASGDSLRVFGDGECCLLELGDSVTRGDFLKPDTDGKGVPIATSGTTAQMVGARALQSGSSGDKIQVQVVTMHKVYPALA